MILDMLPPWARDLVVLALAVYAVAVKLGLVRADGVARLLVGVVEESSDPRIKAAAKKAAEEQGLQPALHKIVVEETEDLGGPLPPAEAHGADTELLAALAARGFTPPQAAPTKPPEVKP